MPREPGEPPPSWAGPVALLYSHVAMITQATSTGMCCSGRNLNLERPLSDPIRQLRAVSDQAPGTALESLQPTDDDAHLRVTKVVLRVTLSHAVTTQTGEKIRSEAKLQAQGMWRAWAGVRRSRLRGLSPARVTLYIALASAMCFLLLGSGGTGERVLAAEMPASTRKVGLALERRRVRGTINKPVATRPYYTFSDPSKRLRISVQDGWHGFFAQFNLVLNELRLAERQELTPYVFIGRRTARHGDNRYFDASAGDNVWEYYFERVSPLAPPAAAAARESDHALGWREERDLLSSADAIKGYYYGRSFDGGSNRERYRANLYDERFYLRHRSEGARLVADYVRVKPGVQALVNAYWSSELAGPGPVLGVHMRGTDKIASAGGGSIVSAAEYARYIRAYVAAFPRARVFVATESPKLLRELRGLIGSARAGAVLRTRPGVLRSGSTFRRRNLTLNQNVFLDPRVGSGRQKGLDVLLDALLLSRCDDLIHGASHVAEAAIWFDIGLHNRSIHLQYETSSRQSPSWAPPPPT